MTSDEEEVECFRVNTIYHLCSHGYPPQPTHCLSKALIVKLKKAPGIGSPSATISSTTASMPFGSL